MPAKKDQPRETRLSHQRIADAALAAIDTEGLEAFSTRRLAAALGVEAMSLYYYFPSKAAVLDAVVEQLLAEIEIPPEGDWRSRILGALHALYGLAATHPGAFPLLTVRRWNTPRAWDFYERVAALLIDEAGLSPAAAAGVFRGTGAYVNGAGLARIASTPPGPPPALERPDVDLRDWPHVAALAPHLRADCLDALFAETLPRILDALAAP